MRNIAVIPFFISWLCLASQAAGAGFGWRALPGAPIADDRHESLFFLEPSLGWLANISGEIHKTTDGGITWRLVHKDADASFRSIAFADSLRGWAGTVYSTVPLFETSDGGESWSPAPVPGDVSGICGLSVVNSSVVYGVGTFFEASPLIKTTDGGVTWRAIDMRERATTLVEARFFSPESGFVTGGFDSAGLGVFQGLRGVILFTADGGETWKRRYYSDSLESWIWKLSFPGGGAAYASMERLSKNSAIVLKSVDSGLTWSERAFTGPSELQGLGFANPALGWAGTRNASYATSDGGETWLPFGFWPGVDAVNRIQMLSDTLGYAAGRTVFKYSRESAALRAPAAPRPGLRASAHPHPFREELAVSFVLDRGGILSLSIHDMRGRAVSLSPGRFYPSGRHVIRIGTRALPPGPYVYRLRAGNLSAAGEVRKE